MRNIYHRLLLLIAGATQRELARYVCYLKTENQILRGKLPPRISVTPQERRRLVRFARRLRGALDELVTIVHPDTVRRWIREEARTRKRIVAAKGRPRTAEEIRKLILKLARETGWGYTRVLGELKKLGIQSITRNTVKNILKQNGFDPGPKRGLGSWDEFLKIHGATLWQCDFFSKKVLTPQGFRDLFVLVFLHVGTRKVFVTPSTYHPNDAWVQKQAAAFVQHAKDAQLGADMLMHDRDTKFTVAFDTALEIAGMRVQKSAFRSPNTMAFVERFVQTIEQECLDYFIVFGQKHMDYLCAQFGEHYHAERPHQGKENELLQPQDAHKPRSPAVDTQPAALPLRQIHCRQRLGGLLKHYYRQAA